MPALAIARGAAERLEPVAEFAGKVAAAPFRLIAGAMAGAPAPQQAEAVKGAANVAGGSRLGMFDPIFFRRRR